MESGRSRIERVSAADGYPLHARVWETRGEPQASVICLHGIIIHGGWYAASCRHLAEQGFEVHFLDRRGSGLNSQARGDVDRFETWMTDVEDYAAALAGDAPKILVGISWGGKLAAAIG